MDSSTLAFVRIASEAFPPTHRAIALSAARALSPFVRASYRSDTTVSVSVIGEAMRIPSRIHLITLPKDLLNPATELSTEISCLLTRCSDGFLRQAAMRNLLPLSEPWVVPYLVLLAGEYVVEIAIDLEKALSQLDRDVYAGFVRENRTFVRLMKARAVSYWDRYYRSEYSDYRNYPGFAFLQRLEVWGRSDQ